jgi:UDP-N-acetylglucosamine--N-acetylmuramyl-(pentapeptide) pyrophosphoryl-undecaprenol N-acetylglucosamine transferase
MIARVAPSIAIACGGTGGHLFPGLAIAQQLVRRNCVVTLFVSPKEIDRLAVSSVSGMEILTLPAVGFSGGNVAAFLRGFVRSWGVAMKQFKRRRPGAVLAMGGFTSAAPLLAARRFGAATFLHESNTIPGRANRWLSRVADTAFVGFDCARPRLRHTRVIVSGTPVRPRFECRDAVVCRVALGLDPDRPVLLVMGGSQGASAINSLVMRTLPLLKQRAPRLQLLHLAGSADAATVSRACAELNLKAVVHSFFSEMDLALGGATVAVSRAGASSLAELAAMRRPAILIPYPAATDNHQFFNARAFEETGAARRLDQSATNPESLANAILDLLDDDAARERMQSALSAWHRPKAAEEIADEILRSAELRAAMRGSAGHGGGRSAAAQESERRNFSAA